MATASAKVTAPRRSLDVESSRSPSAAAQNTSGPKIKKIFQDTLRATGLTRHRGRETPTAERPPPQPTPERTKDKENKKDKSKDDSRFNIRVSLARKGKLSISGRQDKANFQDEDKPFMGSLRQASMSSPVLPVFANPFTIPDASSAADSTAAAALVTPTRPRIYTRRSSTSKDREKEPIAPLQISRPRPLMPTSPSSSSASALVHPNAANAARSVSPHQRNRSPPPRSARISSMSSSHLPSSSGSQHQQRAISPGFHSRNTSTTSLNTHSSPYREIIRTASSLLIKHLSRPPPPLRQSEWQDVELRLRALSRLERIWGKSGGGSSATAVGSGSALGGGEERERKLFCEAVRDGYVLCALLNKFRPGTIARPDPKEDGFTKTSNVTKFLAGALHYGLSHNDIFLRDDLLEVTSESLGRVARTIIAVVKLGEPVAPSTSGSKGLYMSVRGGIMSSPNLLDSQYTSSSGRPYQKKRYSPPSELPSVPGSKPSTPATQATSATRQTRAISLSNPVNGHSADATMRPSSPSAPLPPPRSPLRPNLLPRSSIASSLTDTTTIFSSSDARTSTRFGTVRTVATTATSILPSEAVFSSGQRQDNKTASEEASADGQPPATYQTQFTDIPTTSRRKSYDRDASAARLSLAISQSPTIDLGSPTRAWRERRSSDMPPPDLSNVEEVDEYGTRRGRPPPIDVFVDQSFQQNSGSTPSLSPPRRVSFDRPRASLDKSRDSPLQAEVDLSSTPPKPKAGLPLRRPMHGHRHSVDTVAQSSALLPIPRHSSLSRERQPSPSSSRESSTPSPPTGAIRPALAPRKSSSRPSPRPSYVPKLNGLDDARVSSSYRHRAESDQIETSPSAPGPALLGPRVPFPRSTSGDFANTGTAEPSRLAPLRVSPDAVHTQVEAGGLMGGASTSTNTAGDTYRHGARPALARGRYNSELDTTGTRASRKQRPNSLDDGGVRPGRSRIESMMNLGSSGDALSRENSLNVNAIRQPLVVREEGKPPMHYQIGNGIGRGQFGAVYRALNLNTGQMVAVKRISLQGLSEDEISNLMKEVDVLKRLSHPSIVKYEGMVRSTDTLSIVLEYVENGSLGQTIKAFGKLNERLVATYVTKILEGLHYLHTSHVVHCDLKAANILTTKTGNVKLSDFGVSLNLHAKAMDEIKNDVAGTPNWMAPEVIQLKGPSPASDIWSLGCTAIELLTGHPPYHEIRNGMSVMFRIVEDDMPPIPPECSPEMEDFLQQCFKKDPRQRPDAETLFEHPWLKKAWGQHRDLRPQDSIPFLRRVSVELAKSEAGRGLSVDTRIFPKSDSPQDISDLRGKAMAASPLSPLSPLSPDSVEGPNRQHSFIKTTFGRAVLCRVCHQSVKRSAVLCEECGLIAHARCAADAPASCDIRTQLLLYSQYSQASNSQELSTPTRETASPAASTTPIPIPGSPFHRSRKDSDATFSSSPKFSERLLNWRRPSKSTEPLSPPLPTAMGSPSSYYPPREETPTPVTAAHNTAVASPSTSKRPDKMRRPSRLSFQSAANTDSMRSMVTAAETVSSSTPSHGSTPRSSIPPNHNSATTKQPKSILTNSITAAGSPQSPTSNESVSTDTRRLNTRISAVSSAAASEFGEGGNRIRRTRRDSVSSKESQCIIQ